MSLPHIQRLLGILILAGSMIQIKAGLERGERIALTGVQHLREGLRVRDWELE